MFKNSSFYFILTILLILLPMVSYAQNNFDEQLEFRHDNDFLALSDRYYSSGLFLSYRKVLHKGIFKENKEQIDFTINQEVYTPSQTQSTNSPLFDRSYAGFTGLRTSWSISGENQLFKSEILIGLAGLNSGAGGLQRAFHNIVGILNSPLWVDELNDSFHLNLYFNYVKEWKIAPSPFGVSFAFIPNIALGSRDIYLEPETVFYFGKKNEASNSIAYKRLGATGKELYFAIRTSYRNVIYNGLIEGNLFGDDSAVLRNPENNLWFLGLDLNHRSKRNDYSLGLRLNSRETRQSGGHRFVVFSYGLSF